MTVSLFGCLWVFFELLEVFAKLGKLGVFVQIFFVLASLLGHLGMFFQPLTVSVQLLGQVRVFV